MRQKRNSTVLFVILSVMVAATLPVFWHGDVKRPLNGYEMILAHTRWGHPKSPHKIWDVDTGNWLDKNLLE